MKKTTLFLLIPFFLFATVANDWLEVSDSNYRILFPKLPESNEQDIETAAGKVTMKIKMLETAEDEDDNLV